VPKATNFGNFWQPKVTKIGNFSVTFEQLQNGARKYPNLAKTYFILLKMTIELIVGRFSSKLPSNFLNVSAEVAIFGTVW